MTTTSCAVFSRDIASWSSPPSRLCGYQVSSHWHRLRASSPPPWTPLQHGLLTSSLLATGEDDTPFEYMSLWDPEPPTGYEAHVLFGYQRALWQVWRVGEPYLALDLKTPWPQPGSGVNTYQETVFVACVWPGETYCLRGTVNRTENRTSYSSALCHGHPRSLEDAVSFVYRVPLTRTHDDDQSHRLHERVR